MGGISPALGRRIQQRIDAMDVTDPRAWPARVCKERMNALPLDGNQIYLWALRPDGVVLCLDHESFSHAVEEETDPTTLRTVLLEGARRYPELRELVPPPPSAVRPRETPYDTGTDAEPQSRVPASPGPGGRKPYVVPRLVAGWLDHVDRGHQLELRAGPARALVAGRLAGYYVAADGDETWSSPAGPAARQALMDRLAAWKGGEAVEAHWRENPTACADPFDSADHSLRFSGSGSGGSWVEDFARQPDGSCVVTETLNHDFDPAGPAAPASSTRVLDAAAARAELERVMRAGGRHPFPAIVPRG